MTMNGTISEKYLLWVSKAHVHLKADFVHIPRGGGGKAGSPIKITEVLLAPFRGQNLSIGTA